MLDHLLSLIALLDSLIFLKQPYLKVILMSFYRL